MLIIFLLSKYNAKAFHNSFIFLTNKKTLILFKFSSRIYHRKMIVKAIYVSTCYDANFVPPNDSEISLSKIDCHTRAHARQRLSAAPASALGS